VHAAPREPANADSLPDRQSFGTGTHCRDPTDDFVAEYRGILRNAPVVIQDGEIGVAQTAMFDGDLNVLDPERFEVKHFQHQGLFRPFGDPSPVTPGFRDLFVR
jgi:hypothetical protein